MAEDQIIPGQEPETEFEREGKESPSSRKILVSVAKFAVAGVILWWLYRRGEIHPERLRDALGRWPLLLAVAVITITSAFFQGFRWLALLKSRDIELPPWNAFQYLMEGKFFNLIVPGYFSEDFMRGLYAIRTHQESRSKVIASLLVDRSAGVFTMLLFGAVGLLLRSNTQEDPRLSALLVVCSTAIVATLCGVLFLRVVTRPPSFVLRMAERLHLHLAIDKMYAEAHHYARNLPLLFLAVGMTLVNQGCMILSFYLLGQTLGMNNVAPLDYVVFAPAGMLATMIPIAPVGLGVGQVAFLSLFRLAHSEQGANLFSLYTMVVVLTSLIGGVFYLTNKSKP